MDGTLIDSAEYHWLTWRDTLAREGHALTQDQFASWFGQRNDAILRRYLGDGITPSEISRLGDAKEAAYRDMVRARGIEPLPGVRGWLVRLRDTGWRQAVASSAPPANIEVIIEVLGLEGVFDTWVSAEEVAHGKPAPDVFLRAAEKLGVPAGRSVVVEDAPAGVEAGRRGGMRTIGLTSMSRPLDADIVVASLEDLPDDAFERLVGDGT
jgi:beta-phosphoglucomutase